MSIDPVKSHAQSMVASCELYKPISPSSQLHEPSTSKIVSQQCYVKCSAHSSSLKSRLDLVCGLKSSIVMAAIGGLSKVWITFLNNTKVVGLERLVRYIDSKQPLITVSNHTACMDDPLLWGVLPWKILIAQPQLMRWTLVAKEICFTNRLSSRFFSLGRCLPTIRGHGVFQESVDDGIKVLDNNGWVHVFPEGKVNMLKEKLRLKWGVGRMIQECKFLPTVLPIWHIGMDDVWPNKKPRIPKVGKKLTVVIGDPIDVASVFEQNEKHNLTTAELRSRLARRIQEALEKLKQTAEAYHAER